MRITHLALSVLLLVVLPLSETQAMRPSGKNAFTWLGAREIGIRAAEPKIFKINKLLGRFITLPEVTEQDVVDLRTSLEVRESFTFIRGPISAFKIAEAMTSIGLYFTVMGDYPKGYNLFKAGEDQIKLWQANSDLPLTWATLEEVKGFASKLSELTGRSFFIPEAAQVEYAVRGRAEGFSGSIITRSPYSEGDNVRELETRAWVKSNSSGRAHGVHEPLPGRTLDDSMNSFGVVHPVGNVSVRSRDSYVQGLAYRDSTTQWRRIHGVMFHGDIALGDLGFRLAERIAGD